MKNKKAIVALVICFCLLGLMRLIRTLNKSDDTKAEITVREDDFGPINANTKEGYTPAVKSVNNVVFTNEYTWEDTTLEAFHNTVLTEEDGIAKQATTPEVKIVDLQPTRGSDLVTEAIDVSVNDDVIVVVEAEEVLEVEEIEVTKEVAPIEEASRTISAAEEVTEIVAVVDLNINDMELNWWLLWWQLVTFF